MARKGTLPHWKRCFQGFILTSRHYVCYCARYWWWCQILWRPLPGQTIASFWRHDITFVTVHVTDDDVRFCDGPGMLIFKTTKPCINSKWIALLIHGFVLIKTWLLITCGTAFYAIMYDMRPSTTILSKNRNTFQKNTDGWKFIVVQRMFENMDHLAKWHDSPFWIFVPMLYDVILQT